MSLLLDDLSPAVAATGTCAGGPIRSLRPTEYIEYVIFPVPLPGDPGTTALEIDSEELHRVQSLLLTSSGYALAAGRGERLHDSRAAILEIRRLTGLTWDHLARLFQVGRRSLHFWASGKPLSAANEERLYRVLGTIRRIDRGTAGENRALLFRDHGGQIPFDFLATGRYDELVALVGPGSGRAARELRPLSPAAQAARAPRPPDESTGALQEPAHLESGRLFSATRIPPLRDR